MTAVLIVCIVVAFLLGGIIGSRGVPAVKLHVYRHVDDLIVIIEEVRRHTHDGRIDPNIMLSRLYHLRQYVRLSDKQMKYERPIDFTDRPDQ
jgi:hypothetical protein